MVPLAPAQLVMRVEISGGEIFTFAMVLYVLSPVDCVPESQMGARGLIDDLIVIWLLAVGFASLFTFVVVVFEMATSGPLIAVHRIR